MKVVSKDPHARSVGADRDDVVSIDKRALHADERRLLRSLDKDINDKLWTEMGYKDS